MLHSGQFRIKGITGIQHRNRQFRGCKSPEDHGQKIIAAVSGILGWWKEKSRSKDAIISLLGSLALLGIGLWIITNPIAFDTFLNVIIGLVLIITGVIWLVRGWKQNKDMIMIVMGAIALILGLIIACSNAATSWVIVAEGIGLIYTAITGFIGEKKFSK